MDSTGCSPLVYPAAHLAPHKHNPVVPTHDLRKANQGVRQYYETNRRSIRAHVDKALFGLAQRYHDTQYDASKSVSELLDLSRKYCPQENILNEKIQRNLDKSDGKLDELEEAINAQDIQNAKNTINEVEPLRQQISHDLEKLRQNCQK